MEHSERNVPSTCQDDTTLTGTQNQRTVISHNHVYRGRVRTGCLTCRSRKVKCDEARPVCNNCDRLKRSCLYKSRNHPAKLPPPTFSSGYSGPSTPARSSPGANERNTRCVSPGETNFTAAFSNEENEVIERTSNYRRPESPPSTLTPASYSDLTTAVSVTQNAVIGETSSASSQKHVYSSEATNNAPKELINRTSGFFPEGFADYALLFPGRAHSTVHDPDTAFNVADDSPSALISQDIKITTTMDKLTARAVALQPALEFFVESVECPTITPYDGISWKRMKLLVATLAPEDATLGAAVVAVSALYKAQIYGLPFSSPLKQHQIAHQLYKQSLHEMTDETFLLTALLLCLFDFQVDESQPSLKESAQSRLESQSPLSGVISSPETAVSLSYDTITTRFIGRLQVYLTRNKISPILRRVMIWLQLLHANGLRGGGSGLLAPEISALLLTNTPPEILQLDSTSAVCVNAPSSNGDLPTRLNGTSHELVHIDASSQIFEMLSAPIFDFYFRLQMLSAKIAGLTHYHRSRSTGGDQEHVTQSLSQVRSQLQALWERRSPLQQQAPTDIRSNFNSAIAEQLINLIKICEAAFYTEFVEMDRVLGDPIAKSVEAQECRHHIRMIIDVNMDPNDEKKLSPGFLRPLFMYAIECTTIEEIKWAVKRMKQIQDPICRSDFFAMFGEALAKAQLKKERRITSRYFCIWYFGQSPPSL